MIVLNPSSAFLFIWYAYLIYARISSITYWLVEYNFSCGVSHEKFASSRSDSIHAYGTFTWIYFKQLWYIGWVANFLFYKMSREIYINIIVRILGWYLICCIQNTLSEDREKWGFASGKGRWRVYASTMCSLIKLMMNVGVPFVKKYFEATCGLP